MSRGFKVVFQTGKKKFTLGETHLHIKYSNSREKKVFPKLQPFLRHFTDPASGTRAHNHGEISHGSDGRGTKACFYQAGGSSYSLGAPSTGLTHG